MKKKYSFLVLFLTLYTTIGISQTVIISPSGDGGFETGATFAANGWSATTGTATQNQWVCNTGATTGFSGNRAAYVTNNTAGTPPPHSYTISATRVSHFYRNVTVPAGESHILLDFSWIGIAETTWDRMRVWLVPTGYNPVYGTEITTTGTAPTGRVQVGLADYSNQASWTNAATIYLPATYAGNTFRLVFEWRNDGSFGTNPPAGIDNISLTSEIPPPSYTVPSSGNNSHTVCSGTLYDSGGSGGNYANNSNGYTVINPDVPGNYVQVSGTSAGENCCDWIRIYDGVGTGGTLLWESNPGAGTIPLITSLSGSLTVQFTSDSSVDGAGFALDISCTDTLPPPEYTVPSSGNDSITTCSGTLYDNGGSGGNYASNSNGYTVINPAIAGNYVQVSGTGNTESNWDFLYIYDGAGIGGTLLWSWTNQGTGTFTVPVITSVSGALTVHFTSDGSVNYSGFALDINCSVTPGTEPATPCSSVTDISSCGSIINVTIPSGSSQSVISTSSCGWSTPG
ncbi:MAG: CUB domain-containing protein, partial [Flavobacteriaceae bacterium]|nr:CUB domain-containing protein [Flavobacteriaceae bacterium]